MNATPADTDRGVIREIEGLRAVAVATVLMYHAQFGFTGGYVGVDVFFVVSGFLITRLLVDERRASGHISLRRFYARRMRRLLPAATLVLLVTVALSYRLSNAIRAHQTAVDAVWASLFSANVRFATVGADYLQSTLPPSLLQHWWSLAVEEQFYVVWPGLLAIACWRRRNISLSVVITAGTVAVTSFAIGSYLTTHNPSWGYFAAWSRAWELALGALCTIGWTWRRRLPLRSAAGWLGLAAIGYSAWSFDAHTAFPGTAALLPVLGTVAVIASIGAARGPGALLSVGPLQWIGGRSYGIYLWHWPLLMMIIDRYGSPSVTQRVAVLAVSLLLAAVTYVIVENPLRHLPALTRSAGRSLVAGVAMVAAVLVVAGFTAQATRAVKVDTGYIAATATTPATVASTATSIAPDLHQQLADAIAEQLQPAIAAAAAQELVPENLTPSLSEETKDVPSIYDDGCLVDFDVAKSGVCEYGDLTSNVTIALFGDSHAAQWFPSMEAAAVRNHWKLLVVAKRACPVADVDVMRDAAHGYPSCQAWRPDAIRRLTTSGARLVVIGQYTSYYLHADTAQRFTDEEWRAATERSIAPLQQAGMKVLLLSDTPRAMGHMDLCMADHLRELSACHLQRDVAVDLHDRDELKAMAARLGIDFYDTGDWFCTREVCPVVIGNMGVYLDSSHITEDRKSVV